MPGIILIKLTWAQQYSILKKLRNNEFKEGKSLNQLRVPLPKFYL